MYAFPMKPVNLTINKEKQAQLSIPIIPCVSISGILIPSKDRSA